MPPARLDGESSVAFGDRFGKSRILDLVFELLNPSPGSGQTLEPGVSPERSGWQLESCWILLNR